MTSKVEPRTDRIRRRGILRRDNSFLVLLLILMVTAPFVLVLVQMVADEMGSELSPVLVGVWLLVSAVSLPLGVFLLYWVYLRPSTARGARVLWEAAPTLGWDRRYVEDADSFVPLLQDRLIVQGNLGREWKAVPQAVATGQSPRGNPFIAMVVGIVNRRSTIAEYWVIAVPVTTATEVDVIPQDLAQDIESAVGLADVDVESYAFNERWAVRAADQAGAHALLSPLVIERLLDPALEGERLHFYTGAMFTGARGELDWTDAAPLAHAVADTAAAVPGFVREG